jgi:hypothetical protein
MAERFFSLEEADACIPALERLLRRAIGEKKRLESLHERVNALQERILYHGGLLVDVEKAGVLRLEKDAAVQEMRKVIGEIRTFGCLVKDIDIGLVDFPCRVGGREIYLCWKLGELSVGFWHNTSEGFANRKPIEQEWLSNGRARRGN